MLDGKRILCIEDDSHYAEALEMLFDCYAPGALFAWEPTLHDGIARIETERFDLILLDLRLPDAHDLVALYAFLSGCPGVPIVILSAYEQWKQRALDAGATAFLVKANVNNLELVQRLETILQMQALRSLSQAC